MWKIIGVSAEERETIKSRNKKLCTEENRNRKAMCVIK